MATDGPVGGKMIPARHAEELDASVSDDQPSQPTRAIYVGTAGDISVDMLGSGTAIVFKGLPAGTLLPIQITELNNTGTTATDVVALF